MCKRTNTALDLWWAVVTPATWEAEAGGWQCQVQSWLQSEIKNSLGNLVSFHLKTKKQETGDRAVCRGLA